MAIFGIALSMGSTTTSFAPAFSFDKSSLFADAVANTFVPLLFTTTINFCGSGAGIVVDGDVGGVVPEMGAASVAGEGPGVTDCRDGVEALAGAFSRYHAAANPS